MSEQEPPSNNRIPLSPEAKTIEDCLWELGVKQAECRELVGRITQLLPKLDAKENSFGLTQIKTNLKDVASHICALLKKNGEPQYELAKKIGITPSNMSLFIRDLKSGREPPKFGKKIENIAKGLKVSVEDLLMPFEDSSENDH